MHIEIEKPTILQCLIRFPLAHALKSAIGCLCLLTVTIASDSAATPDTAAASDTTTAPKVTSSPDVVTLTNKEGQSVEVQLLDYSDGQVRCRRIADGFTFPAVPIDIFDDQSRKVVQQWAVDRAIASKRILEATATRRETNAKRDDDGLVKVKTYRGFYTVKLKNISTVELVNIRVEYLLFRSEGIPGGGGDVRYERLKGDHKIDRLAPRQEISFDTKFFQMTETTLSDGAYWVDGSPSRTTARLEGIWIRVFDSNDKDKVIFEYALPKGLTSREEW